MTFKSSAHDRLKFEANVIIGYKESRFDPPGEFPAECVAAVIVGPGFPETGLPFCVPAEDCEIWADRLCFTLSCAWEEGAAHGSAYGYGSDWKNATATYTAAQVPVPKAVRKALRNERNRPE